MEDDEAAGGGVGERMCHNNGSISFWCVGTRRRIFMAFIPSAVRGYVGEDVSKHLRCQFQTNKSFPSYKHVIVIEGCPYA